MATFVSPATNSTVPDVHGPKGDFVRPVSTFRDVIQKGGRFEPERDRYHLYVSPGCPWAHRTLITRKLKGLEDLISISVVVPRLTPDKGWPFASVEQFPGSTEDHILGSKYLSEVYFKAEPNYVGRYTVPVLWDKKTSTIVNNESSEVIRIFNTAFNELLPAEKASIDIYPESLRKDIDELNDWVYTTVNNGVYKSGFAKTQEAYEAAVFPLFKSLDRLEELLADGRDYLFGNQLTEADIRLYVTLVRFDVAYVGQFKCNIKTIRGGYPALHLYLRKLYWNHEPFHSTTDFKHIKDGYYSLNVVPVGPIPHVEPLP